MDKKRKEFWILFWLCFGALLNATNAMAAEKNCSEARVLFERANQTADPNERVNLLRNSLAVCASFNAHYLLGRSLVELNKTFDASNAFRDAYEAASDDYQMSLVLGRQAEIELATGGFKLADEYLTKIESLGTKQPEWLKKVQHQVRQMAKGQVVDAKSIGRMLGGETRGFGVEPVVRLPVNFSFDDAQVKGRTQDQAKELGLALDAIYAQARAKDKKVMITGHTDTAGEDIYNDALSLRRAQAIEAFLDKHYPSLRGVLCAQGLGKRQPLKQQDDPDADYFNRRVEVKLVESCG